LNSIFSYLHPANLQFRRCGRFYATNHVPGYPDVTVAGLTVGDNPAKRKISNHTIQPHQQFDSAKVLTLFLLAQIFVNKMYR
jgi:hypothetical protein